jgi:hypothetical protein
VVKPLVAEPYNLGVAVVTRRRSLLIGLAVVVQMLQHKYSFLLLLVAVAVETILVEVVVLVVIAHQQLHKHLVETHQPNQL